MHLVVQASIMTGTAISLGVEGANKPPAEPILSHRMSPLRRNSLLLQANLLHQNAHLHQGVHLHEDVHLHDEAHIHQGGARLRTHLFLVCNMWVADRLNRLF